MGRIYVGLDNGVSGSIGIVGDDIESFFARHPSRRCKIIQRQRKKCPGWITANSWNFFPNTTRMTLRF